jgi:isocitrate/isopropylmalate dehydrogenase
MTAAQRIQNAWHVIIEYGIETADMASRQTLRAVGTR